ncbi:hypothetical protein P7C73_g5271, partial [Tremellales sp. Uapishka_1]
MPMAPLNSPDAAALSKTFHAVRSYSVSSSSSSGSTSSIYSQTAEDLMERLLQVSDTIHLWTAGNIRFGGRDLRMESKAARELLMAIHEDDRFALVDIVPLDGEGEDWKISYRRTSGFGSVLEWAA